MVAKNSSKQVNKKSVEDTRYWKNLQLDRIEIYEDRLRLFLRDFVRATKKLIIWSVPLGISISTTTTLLTSEFKDYIIPKEDWRSVFLILSIFGWICTFVTSIQAICTLLKKEADIETLVEKIKKPKL